MVLLRNIGLKSYSLVDGSRLLKLLHNCWCSFQWLVRPSLIRNVCDIQTGRRILTAKISLFLIKAQSSDSMDLGPLLLHVSCHIGTTNMSPENWKPFIHGNVITYDCNSTERQAYQLWAHALRHQWIDLMFVVSLHKRFYSLRCEQTRKKVWHNHLDVLQNGASVWWFQVNWHVHQRSTYLERISIKIKVLIVYMNNSFLGHSESHQKTSDPFYLQSACMTCYINGHTFAKSKIQKGDRILDA